MNSKKLGITTAVACTSTAKFHPARDRKGLMISNRLTNTLTAYVTVSDTTPVAAGLCSFLLLPGGFYEYTGPAEDCWSGKIGIVLSGAGPENIDITEQF